MDRDALLIKITFFNHLVRTNASLLIGFGLGLFFATLSPIWTWLMVGGWIFNIIYSGMKQSSYEKQLREDVKEDGPTKWQRRYGLDGK